MNSPKQNNILPTILIVIAVVGISLILMNMVKVEMNDSNLKIKGIYGKSIEYSQINEVSTIDSLPIIGIRKNGIGLGFMNIGHFSYSGIGNVLLFEIRLEKPYVEIKTNEEIIIIGLGKKRNLEIVDELHKRLNSK